MAYLPTGVLVVVGLVLAAVLLLRLRAVSSRFRAARRLLSRSFQDESGLLRARSAALRVAVGQRSARGSRPGARRPVGDGSGGERGAPTERVVAGSMSSLES